MTWISLGTEWIQLMVRLWIWSGHVLRQVNLGRSQYDHQCSQCEVLQVEIIGL